MEKLHAGDWFTITGRGPVAVVLEPEGGWKYHRVAVGDVVDIDGTRYEVLSIEARRPLRGVYLKGPVGLLVKSQPGAPATPVVRGATEGEHQHDADDQEPDRVTEADEAQDREHGEHDEDPTQVSKHGGSVPTFGAS